MLTVDRTVPDNETGYVTFAEANDVASIVFTCEAGVNYVHIPIYSITYINIEDVNDTN